MDKLSLERNSQSESSTQLIRTFFYVFVDDIGLSQPPRSNNAAIPSGMTSSESGNSQESLDSAVSAAFQRLSLAYPNDARVYVKPQPYNEIRKLFGIQELPAFGISDVDLAELIQHGRVAFKPPNLPSVWNVFKWRKRKAELGSGKYLPKIERAVVTRYGDRERLYNFVRDLHVVNIDEGLGGVNLKVEQEIRAIFGKKAWKAVGAVKKVIYPTG